jgi:hypothetical protein
MKKGTSKKVLEAVQAAICNDLMSWDELADKILEQDAEIKRLTRLLKKFQNAPDNVIAHRRNKSHERKRGS